MTVTTAPAQSTTVQLADFVAEFLASQDIRHVFGLTGGAVMHLFAAVNRQERLQPIFTHHEQAAALAAEAYARINGLGAAMVTTGAGGTNAITGVCAAWLDSVPCIFISGQARRALAPRGKPVRQVAPQAIDIVKLVTPITKYAVMVDDPTRIQYELQKAAYLARSGRPGPVWIDIPLDCQWATLDRAAIPAFNPSELREASSQDEAPEVQLQECLQLIVEAQRPLILAGAGIRLAHAEAEFRSLIDRLQIPFLTTWNASDLLPTDHALCVGRPGIFGQRGANLAMQNCDLLLCLGSHLAVAVTGTMTDAFAREAKIIMVDIDREELGHRTVRVDLPIQCDAKRFLQQLLTALGRRAPLEVSGWRDRCSAYKRYNAVPPEWSAQQPHVNPYVFVDMLSEELGANAVIVADGGGTITQIAPQAFRVKEGQRFVMSAGISTMGTLPEAVGACFGSGGKPTIFLCGDGSMQLNIQELETIVHHRLPIKLFVLNNDGYLLIRQSQDDFLNSDYVGSSVHGGVSVPDLVKVAEAYGMTTERIHHHGELREKIRQVLRTPGPVYCDVMVAGDAPIIPRLGFDKQPDGTPAPRPLEDMYPFLDREEFLANMVVKPWGS